MLEIVDYCDEYDEDIMKMDELIYLELKNHKDVISESVCIAVRDGEFAGIGFLMAGASFKFIEERELRYYQISVEYKAVEGTEWEIEASEAILEDLKLSFEDLCDLYPDKRLILRLWSNGANNAYIEFLMMNEFRPMKVTPILEKRLDYDELMPGAMKRAKEELAGINPGLEIKEIFPNKDENLMREYMKSNGSAFEVEDSTAELCFRMAGPFTKVFAVMDGETVVSSVTVWKISDEQAATENIFCIEKYRNQGISTLMLQYAFAYLREHGFSRASLTVFGDNQPAAQLYFKLGYELTGTLIELHYEPDYIPLQY